MAYIGKININGQSQSIGSTLYGTCETSASTVEKTVVLPDFDTLITGVTIHVLFSQNNTASNPTLNVNETGAKRIYTRGNVFGGSWDAKAVVSFTYDGTAWRMNDYQRDSDTRVTATQVDGMDAVFTKKTYPLLVSNSANTNTETAGVYKSAFLTTNPVEKALYSDGVPLNAFSFGGQATISNSNAGYATFELGIKPKELPYKYGAESNFLSVPILFYTTADSGMPAVNGYKITFLYGLTFTGSKENLSLLSTDTSNMAKAGVYLLFCHRNEAGDSVTLDYLYHLR